LLPGSWVAYQREATMQSIGLHKVGVILRESLALH
jgi:hypothetical protein